MGRQTHSRAPSRRDFLKGLGATGAGLVAGSTSAAAGLVSSPGEAAARPVGPGRYARGHGAPASSVEFGRIFPALSPFAEANDTVRAALLEVGKPGGIMDAHDNWRPGPRP